ncbi:hypothetical protein THAOC_28966, partial [Thalassiosira oceanica]
LFPRHVFAMASSSAAKEHVHPLHDKVLLGIIRVFLTWDLQNCGDSLGYNKV